MLKDDVKKDLRIKIKKKKRKEKQQTKLKLDKKKDQMRSLHILFFSTILLISHYLHQTKLEIRRCFQ